MGVLTRNKKQEKRNSHVKSIFLKIVRPGGQVELFRDPIPAGEIMRRYPRHCVTRPDFFDYPWVVVRPDSVLDPGKVFFLVPHHTVDKVTKEKMQQFQQSLDRPLHLPAEPAPRSRGVAPAGHRHDHKKPIIDHHHHHRPRRGHHNHRSNQHEDRYHSINTTSDQDSDNGSLYKEMFYESWEEMRRRLEQLQQEREDSPLESRSPSRELVVVQRPKPCLREAGSGRKRLDLKVSFTCPIVIPGSERGTPVHQGDKLH